MSELTSQVFGTAKHSETQDELIVHRTPGGSLWVTPPMAWPRSAPREHATRHVAVSGSCWRHFKGTVYLVIGIALSTESDDTYVIYRRWGDSDASLWARPSSMWADEARPGVQRFKNCDTGA